MLAQRVLTRNGREGERWAMLISGCTLLPRTGAYRGMEWVGRRVFERGYWKNEDEKKLLHASEGREVLLRVM